MKRIKLKDRKLPSYTLGEEIMNMVTHIVGGALGLVTLVLCLLRAKTPAGILCAFIYGGSMICLYTMSSIYHGLRPSTGKRVMQVLDHCTIYFLIAGTYTPIALIGLAPVFPVIGWGLLIFQWALTALAVILTAIDLKKYTVFSMICYIGMGWAVIFFVPQTLQVLGSAGFGWLLSGGIAYTLGSILYGIGSKKTWFHSVFHIFVFFGSLLQMVSIVFYVF
ncbi:MAG: hemolysin III family protein [Oscillospiraceae bacterium]|nr:hemolysin III family protein [Oscillospiraceae bacterium]